jgi:hypothetical protein
MKPAGAFAYPSETPRFLADNFRGIFAQKKIGKVIVFHAPAPEDPLAHTLGDRSGTPSPTRRAVRPKQTRRFRFPPFVRAGESIPPERATARRASEIPPARGIGSCKSRQRALSVDDGCPPGILSTTESRCVLTADFSWQSLVVEDATLARFLMNVDAVEHTDHRQARQGEGIFLSKLSSPCWTRPSTTLLRLDSRKLSQAGAEAFSLYAQRKRNSPAEPLEKNASSSARTNPSISLGFEALSNRLLPGKSLQGLVEDTAKIEGVHLTFGDSNRLMPRTCLDRISMDT